ncbi:MAG: transcription termination factor NusA [Bacteroidaceae bacterium]|nr:transcription termination factor NusA [Prevotellaceae bacterium]MDY5631581.1 transcription termination factor NusA [Bacteroidaceae bacterium]
MATKNIDTINLFESFNEFNTEKKIDKTTLVSVLEECFRAAIAKTYGSDDNYDIIVNPDKGDFEIYRNRTVVPNGEVKDDNREISLAEARNIEEDYEVGEEVSERIPFANFGRRTILTLRQTLASRILELEHDTLYNQYKDRIGEVIGAEVYQTWKRETMLLDDEGNELSLPRTEQIGGDFFHKGDTARAVIERVENTNGKPKIILSRTSPMFLQRLMEAEVPEIADGLITIQRVARIPGERAKVAVESYDERIDAVGACVGVRGSRIHGIVRELHGESIDVINYTQNDQLLIARALSPAEVNKVILDEAAKKAEVYMNSDQVSLAIGKGGSNIKLASMLCGYTIDVFREFDGTELMDDEEMPDDFRLDTYDEVIEPWIIEELKKAGYNTAKEVLGAGREELVEKVDLEEETIDDVLGVLHADFEDVNNEG